MRKQYSRMAAVVMAVAAGGLAAFALRPAPGHSAATLAARNPAIEVRTQVIRRTIHVIRHEPGARLRGSRASSAVVVSGHGRARTAASGGHRGTRSAGVATAVATRASGSHGSASAPTAQSRPVTTHTSGSHGAATAPTTQNHPVTTRSSGSHGTASGSSSAGSSAHPVTRSSGGGHGHGDDGGRDD